MFCNHCGKEIPNTVKFCEFCGKPVEATVVMAPTGPLQPTEANPYPQNQQPPVQQYQAQPIQTQPVYNQPYPNTATYAEPMPQPQPEAPRSKKGLILGLVFGGVATVLIPIIIFIAITVSNLIGMNNLQQELLRDWSRTESNNGSYYTLELDFSYDTIDYNFDSTYIDQTISTFSYEVTSKNTIEVEGFGEIKVEFNDDKTQMILTPSITDLNSSQYWYNYD